MTDQEITMLSKLLIGVLNAQNAIITAIDRNGAATRFNDFIPALQGAAHVTRQDIEPTLEDLPSRILLQLQGAPTLDGVRPRDEWIHEELTRLLS